MSKMIIIKTCWNIDVDLKEITRFEIKNKRSSLSKNEIH